MIRKKNDKDDKYNKLLDKVERLDKKLHNLILVLKRGGIVSEDPFYYFTMGAYDTLKVGRGTEEISIMRDKIEKLIEYLGLEWYDEGKVRKCGFREVDNE